MHVYLIEDEEESTIKAGCKQSILYLGSTHIVEENEQDIKSCKCRLWSLMQSNDDKPIP